MGWTRQFHLGTAAPGDCRHLVRERERTPQDARTIIRLFFRSSLRGSSLPDFHPSSRVIVTSGENVLGVS
jgi:hypothetical protein